MSAMTFGSRLDRLILKRGMRKGWPLLTLGLIEARRIAGAPFRHWQWLRSARSITGASAWARFVPRNAGFKPFDAGAFPELPAVVKACQQIFDSHAADVANDEAHNKRYFFNIMTVEDLHRHPVLINFALSPAMTQIATGYLGQVPRLHSLGVFYSSVTNTTEGSQIFHVDGDSLAQMKCFVNVWDVKEGDGPFTLLPKSLTSREMRSGGLMKSMADADVFRHAPETAQVAAIGGPGTGMLCDTSRCLHQGSRARLGPRLVFQFQYVSRPDALIARPAGKTVAGGHLHVSSDLLKGLPISNPDADLFVD